MMGKYGPGRKQLTVNSVTEKRLRQICEFRQFSDLVCVCVATGRRITQCPGFYVFNECVCFMLNCHEQVLVDILPPFIFIYLP